MDAAAVAKFFECLAGLHVEPKIESPDGIPLLIERGKAPVDLRLEEPAVEALEFNSLSGLVKYQKGKCGMDEVDYDGAVYHVESPTSVTLLNLFRVAGPRRSFHARLAVALVRRPCTVIGKFMSQEQFMIWAGANLADGQEKRDLLSIVGGLVSSDVREIASDDSGVAQQVQLTAKVSLNTVKTVKPIWKLRPNRTFADVAQPESEFLLRLKKGSGDIPEAALFEADGGRWELDAFKNISEFLAKADPEATVLA